MSELTYARLIGDLFPRLTGGIRWGVDRTERLLEAVGDPHHRYATIHVGGTNGKGSVAATLASVLAAAGLRVGLYTSPHLCTFRERILVDGRPLSEADLVACATELWPWIRREAPSFFEATTAIAFLAFARLDVEIAVVEVGLGGRLDATNVIIPEVSVITNVARDHAEYLGETIEEIASEKAGIMKPGVPVVTGESGGAYGLLMRRAREVGAPFHRLDPAAVQGVRVDRDGTRFRLRSRAWGVLELHTPLIGAHQARNAALAVEALAQLPREFRPRVEAIVEGVRRVRWPGRLQWEERDGQNWIFDAAHNPAGVEAVVDALRSLRVPQPVVAVVGILREKDWAGMLRPLCAFADTLVLTVPPTAPEHRRWDPERAAAGLASCEAEVVRDFGEALAVARARAGEGTVLVTGSFHTVGDALARLGLAPHGVDPPLPMAVGQP